ncbi:glycosyltransferase family 2 protein [Corallincola holothuriorum]|uniref:Glycosyltransferase family 2 protein n=1 Tax=Corallincola holothuriorum TaxID=2282215 RepID=A0A368NRJ6_9GAMM|nr:glycosyltransferase family 2 protein [Corallincola holothuriorum]
MVNYSPCIIIPIYNHGSTIGATVSSLLTYNLPILIVDDGSDASTHEILDTLATQNTLVSVDHLPSNLGKGGAVMAGIRKAAKLGYSHAIQVDADGQHDLNDLTKLVKLAHENPNALVSGQPEYDESVPTHRYIARYITHVWVWIETLSFSIKDSMCGFRAYPIKPCVEVLDSANLGQRMDFDPEIMVRLYWHGVQIITMPTKVIYPKDGVSHFRGLEDNLRISWMHTRLFFGMLKRLPFLVFRKRKAHWSDTPERGGVRLMLALYHSYRLLGRPVFSLLLKFVMLYYVATSSEVRFVCKKYWSHVLRFSRTGTSSKPGWRQTYKHLLSFGEAMLDKLAVWAGDITIDDLDITGENALRNALKHGKGAILFVSHFGNIEVCRALGRKVPEITKINALVFNTHAQKFNKVLKHINAEADFNLIHLDEIGIDTSIQLKDMVDNGEIIVIAADRTPVGARNRITQAEFLGQKASFSQGPFILASILQCPTFTMFCARNGKRFEVGFKPFSDQIMLPRKTRDEALGRYVTQYSEALESWVVRYPEQWFNFFDFWQAPETSEKRSK